MILSILKYLSFAALVLLLGQISVGTRTIGDHFAQGVATVAHRGTEEIGKNRYVASVIPGAFSRWIHNMVPPHGEGSAAKAKKTVEDTVENYTTSDRESIVRLLQ
jgi:hypothetical protein